jgi:CHAT domain-containing protein
VSINKNSLTILVEKTRKAIQSNSPTDINGDLSQLYSLLIEPVEKNLASISDLVIILNGSLHFLPFQSLINDKGEYLVQKFNLVYSPSVSVFILCHDKEVKAGVSFMGMALSDISVGNNVGLPGTETELKKILPLFSLNISTFGLQSTESFAKKMRVFITLSILLHMEAIITGNLFILFYFSHPVKKMMAGLMFLKYLN